MGKKKDKKGSKAKAVKPPLDPPAYIGHAKKAHAAACRGAAPPIVTALSRPERIVNTLLWAADIEAVPVDSPNGTITWPCPDGWVPAWLLAQPRIGGASCDRRLRELVLNNPNIEKRLVADGTESTVEYRYVTSRRKNRR